ncbi:hypothetical protein JT358_03340 [Micrococcales bacterium 31B]|nr:hypothetical protein [Micrococcales bacterium 31B]
MKRIHRDAQHATTASSPLRHTRRERGTIRGTTSALALVAVAALAISSCSPGGGTTGTSPATVTETATSTVTSTVTSTSTASTPEPATEEPTTASTSAVPTETGTDSGTGAPPADSIPYANLPEGAFKRAGGPVPDGAQPMVPTKLPNAGGLTPYQFTFGGLRAGLLCATDYGGVTDLICMVTDPSQSPLGTRTVFLAPGGTASIAAEESPDGGELFGGQSTELAPGQATFHNDFACAAEGETVTCWSVTSKHGMVMRPGATPQTF